MVLEWIVTGTPAGVAVARRGADGRRPYDGPAEVSYNEGWESVTRIPLN